MTMKEMNKRNQHFIAHFESGSRTDFLSFLEKEGFKYDFYTRADIENSIYPVIVYMNTCKIGRAPASWMAGLSVSVHITDTMFYQYYSRYKELM